MKRALLAVTLLVCSAAQAQRLDPTAPLKNYAAKVLPQCPGGVLTLDPLQGGPRNFTPYVVAVRSTDKYCGGQKYLLYSPSTQQIVIGTVIPLENPQKPAHIRISEQASQL
ncbi:MAG: hypothetical protein ACLGH0_10145, partial [Thermoanaerobaculia bacterium]